MQNMPDEMIDLESNAEEINSRNRVEERIKSLSDKVRLTAEERDAAQAKIQAEAEARAKAEKERDFYASFSDSVTKYPGASEYKSVIMEKVLSGYSTEDATIAVLAKEGKLGAAPVAQPTVNIGGSAINLPQSGTPKPLSEMSREEKRQALRDAEARGDISMS